MPTNNLNFADGQVATTATQITAGPSNDGQRINGTFCNTGTAIETLTLTMTRNGGTARRIFQCVLDVNEQLVVTGLAINSGDSLLAVTTTALEMDYMLSLAGPSTPLSFQVFDDQGNPRTNPAMIEQMMLALN